MSIKTKTLCTRLGLFTFGLIAWHLGLLTETAHAAIPIIPGGGAVASGTLGGVLVDLIDKVAMLNSFMHVLLLIILQFLQYFLQADFFNDPTMMNGLFTIWKLCRDIMNIIFALALIGVSFYVIITAKSDMIKEKLAQFVIAVIFVNFSWFFPRVIIDVANVLTSAVYSVPSMLPAPSNTCTMIAPGGGTTPCKVATAVLIFPKDLAEMDTWCNANGGGSANTASCPCIDKLECHVLKDYATAVGTMKPAHAMINGMAVSFAKITELATVPGAGVVTGGIVPDPIKTSMRIGLSVMMALLVQIAILLPLIAMAVGFLIRIIVLWVTTAFMPFSFLGYMINGKLGTAVFGFEVDIWKEFINAAFLPATVGIPFVVGFIMLTTVSSVPAPAGMPFNLGIPMINGVTSWWAMLWVFAAIGIIWKGAFSALKKSELVGKFTEKIRAAGEYVAGGVAQLPLITPLPIPGLKGGNLGTVVHSPRFLADAIRSSASGASGKSFTETVKDRFGAGGGGGGGATGARLGIDTTDLAVKLKDAGAADTIKIVDAINRLGTGAAGEAAGIQGIKEALRDMGHAGAMGMSNGEALRIAQEISNKQNAGEALKDAGIVNKITDAMTRHP